MVRYAWEQHKRTVFASHVVHAESGRRIWSIADEPHVYSVCDGVDHIRGAVATNGRQNGTLIMANWESLKCFRSNGCQKEMQPKKTVSELRKTSYQVMCASSLKSLWYNSTVEQTSSQKTRILKLHRFHETTCNKFQTTIKNCSCPCISLLSESNYSMSMSKAFHVEKRMRKSRVHFIVHCSIPKIFAGNDHTSLL